MARRLMSDPVSDAVVKKRKMNNEETDLELKLDRILDRRIKQSSVVGKFISEERVLNSKNIGEEIHRAWPVDHPFEVHEIGDNLFFFVFQTIMDKLRVVNSNRPWVVNGKLLVVRDLPDKMVGMEEIKFLDFKTQDFWVRLHGTEDETEPLFDVLNESGLFYRVADVDVRFERFKVSVVLNRPLPTGLLLRSSNGTTVNVTFKYENLPDLCPCCGLFGHDSERCWVADDRSTVLYNETILRVPTEQLDAAFQGQWDGIYEFPVKAGYSPIIEDMEIAIKGRRSFMPYFNHVKMYGSLKADQERSRSDRGKCTQRIRHKRRSEQVYEQ